VLRWSNYWTSAFVEGPHMDAWRSGLRVARVVAMRQVASVPVMHHPSGRERRLYLAMINRGDAWEIVGVFGTANKARRDAERALREVNS
jgi:hypothetical protein